MSTRTWPVYAPNPNRWHLTTTQEVIREILVQCAPDITPTLVNLSVRLPDVMVRKLQGVLGNERSMSQIPFIRGDSEPELKHVWKHPDMGLVRHSFETPST